MNDILYITVSLVCTFAADNSSTNPKSNKQMKEMKRLLLSLTLALVSTLMYAQSEISGTVVDATGETVIGATVMEKGTSNGTITDFDGNFKLKVEAGKTLVISYIGFETQELPAQDGMQVTSRTMPRN